YHMGRREFVKGLGALAGGSLLGYDLRSARAEPPPETKKVRLTHTPAICLAPQYLVEDLLRLEGFSEIEYVKSKNVTSPDVLTDDRADFTMWDAYSALTYLDEGKPLVVIGGIHAGCYQLFATGAIRSLRDLKGKTVAVYALGQGAHVLVASMLA